MLEDILDARENRYKHLMTLSETYKKPLIVVKANTMGNQKNSLESEFIVKYFYHMLYCNSIFSDYFDSADGPYAVLVVNQDPFEIKKRLVNIEDKHPLGRLVDLDVFDQGTQLSRAQMQHPLRKCLLCDQPAVVCMKSRSHSYDALIQAFNKQVRDVVIEDLTQIAKEAMRKEIDLDPKFGLVTPYTQGSHPDMTYDMMCQSQKVLLPYFKEMIKVAYDLPNLKDIFTQARRIGVEAEKAMFESSNGVNTYKGLVFVLGLILTSSAYVIKHQKPFSTIFESVSTMSQDILKDLPKQPQTFGEQAFIEQQFGGVRLEAINGFPTLQVLLEKPEDLSEHQALIELIILAEDSVMLKRAKTLERYFQIKKLFESVNPYDFVDLQRVTLLMITQNMSFGGAADLLTGYITLKALKSSHYFSHNT